MKLNYRPPFPLPSSIHSFLSLTHCIHFSQRWDNDVSLQPHLHTPFGIHAMSNSCFSKWYFFSLVGILSCLLGEFMENFIHITWWLIAQALIDIYINLIDLFDIFDIWYLIFIYWYIYINRILNPPQNIDSSY